MESTRRESEKRNLLSGKDKDLELLDVRSDAESSTSTLYDNMESDEKLQKMDVEKQNTPTLSTPAAVRSNRMRLTVWMIINTLATIAIVSQPRPRCGRNASRNTEPPPFLRWARLRHLPPANDSSSIRSSPTKPSSTIHLSNNVKLPLRPFISSSPL